VSHDPSEINAFNSNQWDIMIYFSFAVKEVKILQTVDPAKREDFLECKFIINSSFI